MDRKSASSLQTVFILKNNNKQYFVQMNLSLLQSISTSVRKNTIVVTIKGMKFPNFSTKLMLWKIFLMISSFHLLIVSNVSMNYNLLYVEKYLNQPTKIF